MFSHEKPQPQMEFSYFSTNERQKIAKARDIKLLRLINETPYLLPRFFHELWRTNRLQDVYRVVCSLGLDGLDPALILGYKIESEIVNLCTTQGESLSSCEDYLRSVIITSEKAISGVKFDAILPADDLWELNLLITTIIRRAGDLRQTWISQWN